MNTTRHFHAASLALLLAVTISGCSGGSDADDTAPTITLETPASPASRVVTLRANANDDRAVTSVEFRVDGTSVGTASASPFTASWNTGSASEGAHSITAIATDAAGNSTTSAAVSVTVQNQRTFDTTMSGSQETAVTPSEASGAATLNVNLATGAASGSITFTGLSPTMAHIHDGFAGQNGPVIVDLQADPADANRWVLVPGATLTSTQVDKLLEGGLYFNAHTTAFQAGEIRGQILPANVSVLFTDLTPLQEIPETASLARGRAGITLNTSSRLVNIHVNVIGADQADNAHLHRGVAGVNGPVVTPLTKDAAAPSRWSATNVTLAQADVDALLAAGTYLNIHTPQNTSGEIRGQVVPSGYLVVVSRMNGEQEVPAPRIAAARGTSAATINLTTGAIDAHVNVTGADDATMAHLHAGFAGTNGPVVVNLEKDASLATHWRSNGATLTSEQVTSLRAGGFYANVHTPAAPAGLVRGQLLPSGIELVVSHLTGGQESSPVTTNAFARASTTIDTQAKRLTVHVNTVDLDDATDAHIHRGARGVSGPVAIPLTQDGTVPSLWSAVDVDLTDEQLQDYRDGTLYVNVHTPANPTGEVRGQIELGGVVPFQFEEIQTRIFNTTCALSGCHTGGAAPVGLSLDAGSSHTNLVGVASGEVPSLMRVAPGDAPSSYIVQKLEGAAGIVGARMPFGGTPLPDETIARIRAWINSGALPAPAPPAPDTQAPVVTLGNVPDPIVGTIQLTATATDDVGVTLVRFRVNGTEVGSDATEPYSFDWASTGAANGAVTIDAQALDAAGNVGTSAATASTVSNPTGPVPFTFTEIQTQIFNVSCIACHSGGAPAGGMSLEASAYARIVNVASSEVPTLMRIEPNDSAGSYMIQKLEGAAGIVGSRMPLGGPFLNQATIDRIKAWVDSGAPNN